MFSKAKSKDLPLQKPKSSEVPSIIAHGLTVSGNVCGAGEVQIDGVIEGDVECRMLTVGINGIVSGQVRADQVRLHGQVTGEIHAKSVFLASTSRVVGDVTHESLAIEPGAFLEGHCRRLSEGEAVGLTDQSRRYGHIRLASGVESPSTQAESAVPEALSSAANS